VGCVCGLVVVWWPWVSVARGCGSWVAGVVADKMGCGGFGFAGVGMVVVGLGLPTWVWGLWVVAVVEEV
jgi:hypothetical protein